MGLYLSSRDWSPSRTAAFLAAAFAAHQVRYRTMRVDGCLSYVIGGRVYAPWQAANAHLPGGWRGFYDQIERPEEPAP